MDFETALSLAASEKQERERDGEEVSVVTLNQDWVGNWTYRTAGGVRGKKGESHG